MNELSELIYNIEFKSVQLIKNVRQLNSENQELKEKINQLENIIDQYKNQIKNKEEQNKVTKIINTLGNTENRNKAKLKINELLREVDRCIALLNK
jgi:outer membrane murein-binding lipoprotein Lpp